MTTRAHATEWVDQAKTMGRSWREPQQYGTRRPKTGARTITRAASSRRCFRGGLRGTLMYQVHVFHVTGLCGVDELYTLHGERPPAIFRGMI